LAVKAAMVNDFDVLAFFNSHLSTWNQSARGVHQRCGWHDDV
jgi:hypothetical protein